MEPTIVLFKTTYHIDYIDSKYDIPKFIINNIRLLKLEYSSVLDIEFVNMSSKDMMTEFDSVRSYRKYRANSFCENNEEKIDDIYLNRYNVSTIEFVTNRISSRFRIFTYFTKISGTIKKCTTEIHFNISHPSYQPYSTKNNVIIEFLKEFGKSIQIKISAGTNKITKMDDHERYINVMISNDFKKTSCKIDDKIITHTSNLLPYNHMVLKLLIDNFEKMQKMISGISRLRKLITQT